MDHIDIHLATAAQNANCSVSIHAALAIGKRTLNWYYNKTDHSEIYRIAMGMCCSTVGACINHFIILHPCHKLHYFRTAGWENTWIETVQNIVHKESDRTYMFMDIDTVDEVVSMDQI